MRLARALCGSEIAYGIVEGSALRIIEGNPFERIEPTEKVVPLSSVQLLSPVEPSKVIAVGLNYIDHAKELGMPVPEVPILFMKPSTAVIGPGEKIIHPSSSEQVDYEAELAVIIGKRSKDIPESETPDRILGYSCGNDVTARDLQKKDGQWTRCKSFDTFCPLGPWIETELDPSDLKIEAHLNGKVKQSSSTANLIFGVEFLVSFISRVMTLLPGDVILTGTPFGVGPMKRGDEIEVRIEGIGSLVNAVI